MANEWISRSAKDLKEVTPLVSSIVLILCLTRDQREIKKLCLQLRNGSILSSNSYQIFMDYLVSHLYVANPQARIGAIQTMTMGAYNTLKARGMVPCTNFKTAETYGYQYISACEASMRLLIISSAHSHHQQALGYLCDRVPSTSYIEHCRSKLSIFICPGLQDG